MAFIKSFSLAFIALHFINLDRIYADSCQEALFQISQDAKTIHATNSQAETILALKEYRALNPGAKTEFDRLIDSLFERKITLFDDSLSPYRYRIASIIHKSNYGSRTQSSPFRSPNVNEMNLLQVGSDKLSWSARLSGWFARKLLSFPRLRPLRPDHLEDLKMGLFSIPAKERLKTLQRSQAALAPLAHHEAIAIARYFPVADRNQVAALLAPHIFTSARDYPIYYQVLIRHNWPEFDPSPSKIHLKKEDVLTIMNAHPHWLHYFMQRKDLYSIDEAIPASDFISHGITFNYRQSQSWADLFSEASEKHKFISDLIGAGLLSEIKKWERPGGP